MFGRKTDFICAGSVANSKQNKNLYCSPTLSWYTLLLSLEYFLLRVSLCINILILNVFCFLVHWNYHFLLDYTVKFNPLRGKEKKPYI